MIDDVQCGVCGRQVAWRSTVIMKYECDKPRDAECYRLGFERLLGCAGIAQREIDKLHEDVKIRDAALLTVKLAVEQCTDAATRHRIAVALGVTAPQATPAP